MMKTGNTKSPNCYIELTCVVIIMELLPKVVDR